MKKNLIIILLVFSSQFVFSQVSNETAKKTKSVKTTVMKQQKIIPAARTSLARKDLLQLKIQLTQLSDSISIIKKDIDAQAGKIKSSGNMMSEMGEMESLRLQMTMDRLSKMMTTLSNLLKKISDTSQSITQNIK